MNDVAIVVREVQFSCTPWLIEDEKRIQPVPGTWTLAPVSLWNRGIHGVLSCPNCSKAALIPHEMGEPASRGRRLLKQFGCTCGFVCNALLEDWDTRKLYCVVWHMFDSNGKILVEKDYMHALSREEARYFFEQSHLGTRYQIVDVGPVVGYFMKNEKNEKDLSV